MPIRINYLAEQQAEEELRRRDPVKRAVWAGGLTVFLVLVWSGWLQLQLMHAANELNNYESKWRSLEAEYGKVATNLQTSAKIEVNLAALQRLATNRFLWGSALNALQMLSQNPNIQLTKLEALHTYVATEGAKGATNVSKGTPAKSASATERIILTIDARDWGRPADQGYIRFKDAIASATYFKGILATNGVSLVSISLPQSDPSDLSRTFMAFTLQCKLPDRVR